MNSKKQHLFPLIIIGILFFVFGFVTWVNGTLITFFKKSFNLDNTGSLLVTFAFFISYTVMALPSSKILKIIGFKKGMAVGLLIMAIGTLIFIPSAKFQSYYSFLFGLFTIGGGLTLLQTASNPYLTILGDSESAAQRISIMGIANKLAGIFSQKMFGGLLLASSATSVKPIDTYFELQKVVVPYAIISLILLFLGVIIWNMNNLPEISDNDSSHNQTPIRPITSYPNLILGCIALFLYVGLEVISGDTIINYGISIGIPESESKNFGIYTLWFMLLGYVLSVIIIPKYITQQKWLEYSSIGGIFITFVAVFTAGIYSIYSIAALGFVNAVMWPAIWPLALRNVGVHTKLASALLIMMIAGGAILPIFYGKVSDIFNTQLAYLIIIPMYIFIFYYAKVGHTKNKW